MPISKSMFATLKTVLSFMCFHNRCAASLILASTVPGVTIGIEQKRERPFNDLSSLEALVSGRFEVVRAQNKISRPYFLL